MTTTSIINQDLVLLTLICLLYTILLISYYLQSKRIKFIHETIISTILGVFVGFVIRLVTTKTFQEGISFDSSYFFNLLLPPIIYHSGYNMKRSMFFYNFGTILMFALLGTFISTIIIGFMLYIAAFVCQLSLSFLDCIIVGSILSSTDPVTVLAIFQQLNVDPTLYSVILGESLLNDSVAIVLFGTLVGDMSQRLFKKIDTNCKGNV
jgi:sodium/hydrogen exchanger-like protein 6/7